MLSLRIRHEAESKGQGRVWHHLPHGTETATVFWTINWGLTTGKR